MGYATSELPLSIYFSYDLRLFEDIRWTKKIAVFPVGLIGYQAVSSPIVANKTTTNANPTNNSSSLSCEVVGFSDPWFANRKFPIDMAGFAANVDFVASHPHQAMPYKVGYEEDYFLQSLNVSFADLEPKADCCTKLYIWHTKTVSRKRIPILKYVERYGGNKVLKGTNLGSLMKELEQNGLVNIDRRRGQQIFTCTEANGCDSITGRS